jgi:biopolymer transport protein ExbB
MLHNLIHATFIDVTLYVLLAFSVVTWTLIIFKAWQFSKNSFSNQRFHTLFWQMPSLAEAEALPERQCQGPQARIAKQGINWIADNRKQAVKTLKYQGQSMALLEQSLVEQLQTEQQLMESGLTLLASIGSTAPFVGLFGTVLGIMDAMHDITESGSTSLDVVAGPIGDALVATAIGIAVAVPAVLAYNFFLRRAKRHKIQLENFVSRFLMAADRTDGMA